MHAEEYIDDTGLRPFRRCLNHRRHCRTVIIAAHIQLSQTVPLNSMVYTEITSRMYLLEDILHVKHQQMISRGQTLGTNIVRPASVSTAAIIART